eukprot:1138838-Pelagomonas_calceolata.AAC.6
MEEASCASDVAVTSGGEGGVRGRAVCVADTVSFALQSRVVGGAACVAEVTREKGLSQDEPSSLATWTFFIAVNKGVVKGVFACKHVKAWARATIKAGFDAICYMMLAHYATSISRPNPCVNRMLAKHPKMSRSTS